MRNLMKLVMVLCGILALFTVLCVGIASAQTDDAEALRLARQVAADLTAEKFGNVVALFDETMKGALSEANLAASWATFAKPLGSYQGEVAHTQQDAQGYKVVTLTIQFEKGALDVRTAFNAKGQLSGLFFNPNKTGSITPTPPDYVDIKSFTETEVKIGAGREFELPGTLILPNGAGKFPAVILLQGSGPSDRDETIGPNKPFRDIAWGLASQGIAVLRYDKRSFVHGAKMNVSGLTVKQEYIDDALAAIELLRKTDKVDATKIFLLGHSEGGLVAPRIAAADPKIAGVLFAAGLTSRPLPTLIRVQLEYIASLNSDVPAELKKAIEDAKALEEKVASLNDQSDPNEMIVGVPASYWLDLRDYDAIEAASQLKMPLFVAQGERDYQVTMEDFEAAKQGLVEHSDSTFKSYPKLNHVFIAGSGKITPQEYAVAGNVDAEFIADVAAWIKSH